MRYSLIKHGPDGMAATVCADLEQALSHIDWYGGWTSLEHLHRCICLWAADDHPGGVFCTRTTAIVPLAAEGAVEYPDSCPNCDSDDDVDYGDIEPEEGGNLVQRATCTRCGEQWMDGFALSYRAKMTADPKLRKAWDADSETKKGEK